MKQAILDTSFILSALINKIDLFEELMFQGIKPIIPKKVIEELAKKDKSELSLLLIKKSNSKIIDLGDIYADKQIINYAKENPSVLVATLDKEIQKAVKNPKIIIRNKKQLMVTS